MTNAGSCRSASEQRRQARHLARAYNDGAWHHVVAHAGRRRHDAVRRRRPGAANTAVKSSATVTRGYWRVGGDTLSLGLVHAPTSRVLRGTLDETAVYPAALTAAQVKAHFDLGR